MALDYDATSKFLIEVDPMDWIQFLGLPGTSAYTKDVDISTVSGSGDVGIFVEADEPYVAHLEFQSGYDKKIDNRTHRYNALIHYETDLPVKSYLILLRPSADGSGVTGGVHYEGLDFRYNIIRPWEYPPEAFLNGGLSLLPLAPLSNVSKEELPKVIETIEKRLDAEASPGLKEEILTATFIFSGLIYSDEFLTQIFQGVKKLKESSTYQYIYRSGQEEGRSEGRSEEAIRIILRIGEKRYGEADDSVKQRLESCSLEVLEALAEKLFSVETWGEFLPITNSSMEKYEN